MPRYDRSIDAYASIAVARWLREWRLSLGVSQRTVARMAGINQGGLSRIERGLAGRPSGWRLARLLVVLDWLAGGGNPDGPWAQLDHPRPERLPPDTRPRPPAIVGTWQPADPPPSDDPPPAVTFW